MILDSGNVQGPGTQISGYPLRSLFNNNVSDANEDSIHCVYLKGTNVNDVLMLVLAFVLFKRYLKMLGCNTFVTTHHYRPRINQLTVVDGY